MTEIQLIPVLEIPHPVEAWKTSGQRPLGNWCKHPQEWEIYLTKVNVNSGYGELHGYPLGSGLYPVSQFSSRDISRVIELHVDDLVLEDCCALFGGFVLVGDGQPIFVPQCCSTLADISSWESIARSEVFSNYFCLEGHPTPQATSNGESIQICCIDEGEAFFGPAPKGYSLSRSSLAEALTQTHQSLKEFSNKLEGWGSPNGYAEVSKILIYDLS